MAVVLPPVKAALKSSCRCRSRTAPSLSSRPIVFWFPAALRSTTQLRFGCPPILWTPSISGLVCCIHSGTKLLWVNSDDWPSWFVALLKMLPFTILVTTSRWQHNTPGIQRRTPRDNECNRQTAESSVYLLPDCLPQRNGTFQPNLFLAPGPGHA